MYWLNDGTGFKTLKINDNYAFSTLTAYTKMISNLKIDCSWMDICIGTLHQDNLNNQSMEDFHDRLTFIQSYLTKVYGIMIDFTDAKFKTMEINTTIELNSSFKSYHRIFRILMHNMPSRFPEYFETHKNKSLKQKRILNSFYCYNQSMTVKIYDKSGYSKKNYMRLEFGLKTSKKVKESFGSNQIYHITDNMIAAYFSKQFMKLFYHSYRRWYESNQRYLSKLLRKHKRINATYWKRNLLNECSDLEQRNTLPVLLDIEDLLKVVKNHDHNRHYARDKRAFYSYEQWHSVYFQHDSQKAREVLDKIHKICYPPDI